jgi:hypothetical protein
MAKSRTKRKLNRPEVREVIEMAEAASVYIGMWERTETQKILAREPVIVPTSWGFRVGKFSVKGNNGGWDVYDVWNQFIKSFTSKKSAIYWALLTITGRYVQSQKLYEQDTMLSKYTQDQTNYSHMKQRSLSKKDYFMVDICNARLAKNESVLEYARNELEKTLNSAKYLKGIWEKPL